MKSQIKLAVTLSVVALITGCSKKSSPAQQAPIYPNGQRVCEQSEFAAEIMPVASELHDSVISLERVMQRTIRRDCSGRVVSDSYEQVRSGRTEMRLDAYRNTQNLRVRLEAFNHQTCDSTSVEPRSDFDNDLVVPLSINRANARGAGERSRRSLQVEQGDNIISYKYYVCDPRRDGRNCEPQRSFGYGGVRLRVNYRERNVGGIREVEARHCGRDRR